MSKKSRNIFKSIQAFFHPIQTTQHSVNLERDYEQGSYMAAITNMTNAANAFGLKPEVSEEKHHYNMELIEVARLEQEREITNNNLKAQHRTLIITTVATFIALLSSISAVFIAQQKDTPPAPIVNITSAQQAPPDVQVYVRP